MCRLKHPVAATGFEGNGPRAQLEQDELDDRWVALIEIE